ncbi:MAG: hypothetical protein ACU0GG_04530 [Paracoccaceae bacterium]
MDLDILLAILIFGTLGAVAVFALVSKKRTEDRLEDDQAEKSRLAADAPDK